MIKIKKYFIYYDYSTFPKIKQAINDLIQYEKIRIIKKIGHSENENFTQPLFPYEGLICIEV